MPIKRANDSQLSGQQPAKNQILGRFLGSLVLFALVAVIAYGAWAAFDSSADAGNGNIQSGQINLTDNTSGDLFGTAGLDLTAGQAPVERCYTLTNSNSASSVPAEITLALGVTGSGSSLRDRLRFSVEKGSSNGGVGTGCTNFNPKAERDFVAGDTDLANNGAAPSANYGAAGASSGAILGKNNSPNLLNSVTVAPGQSVPLRIRFFPTHGSAIPAGQNLNLTLAVNSVSAATGENR